MITLQLLVLSFILELPLSGNTFSVWDIGLIGLITIVLRLICNRLLNVKGLANAVSFNLSLVTAGIPMIWYMWWHAANEVSYKVSSNIWMLILCGIIWVIFWQFVNPWYYKEVCGYAVSRSFIPYYHNNIVLKAVNGLIQLMPMTVFVCYAWYAFAGHFSTKAILAIVLANFVWVVAFIIVVAQSRSRHTDAVIETAKDPYSDHVENETDSRFEVKLSAKNHIALTFCKIAVLYAALCLDGLYYDRIHNDMNAAFKSTAAIAFLVSVVALIAAYLIQDRISLRVIVNKKRFGIHRAFSFCEVIDESDIDNYENVKGGKAFTLYYDSSKDITLNGMYENLDKLRTYITTQTKVEEYVPLTPEQKKEKAAKAAAIKAEQKAAKQAKRAEEKAKKEAEKKARKEAAPALKAAKQEAKEQAKIEKARMQKKKELEKVRKEARDKKKAQRIAEKKERLAKEAKNA